MTTRLIAAAFALCGFAVAIVAGLAAGNSGARVLTTALVSMIACQAAGMLVGAIGQRAVSDYMTGYTKARPVPGMEGGSARATDSPQISHKT